MWNSESVGLDSKVLSVSQRTRQSLQLFSRSLGGAVGEGGGAWQGTGGLAGSFSFLNYCHFTSVRKDISPLRD